ncbi:MAG: cyanophycin synthetase [Planctomycetota bacterium]|jgi:dihydrofolate synthase/folylpolyglutamate synthase|nr:cyanophycin synthetase [Planctomycetota bacterium]MDP6940698.1 cyanophycin synthetase [Planctomycetota bacterium]
MEPLSALWDELVARTDYERCERPRAARFSLDGMAGLCARLGFEPSTQVGGRFFPPANVIHLAGSKGKGSTAHFLELGLRVAGFRTGLYTSPHLESWRERVQVSGEWVEETAMSSALSQVLGASTGEETFFDLLTASAFVAFREAECDYWILETGLGGRFDSTNVLESQSAVVTSIELEHTDVLGSTLEVIAGEKAGIYQPFAHCWSALDPNHPASRILAEKAEFLGAKFSVLPESSGEVIPADFPYEVSTMRRNFQLAQAVLTGIGVSTKAMQTLPGEEWVLPGRFEVRQLQDGREVVLDVAHSAESLAATLLSFRKRWPHENRAVLFALRDDKNPIELAADLERLSPRPADESWFVLPAGTHPRSATPESLSGPFMATPQSKFNFPSLPSVFLVTGSTYLVGALRPQTTHSTQPA